MRTTISVPDELFESADALAERLDVSRSRLYAAAVADYVAKHRHADTTDRLDAVYTEEEAGVDPAIRSAHRRSVTGEW